ncbi:MAG: hypothetical protein CVU14_12695, partial [Bacteroidetes bacterium HGW-Bacteroidetes-9]
DSVCVGSERHYRIDGEENSTYAWRLTDPIGTVTYLPETADTITVVWNMAAGEYIMSVTQTSIHGCDSIELGTIHVFELPQAFAGINDTLCNASPYTLAMATATDYSGLLWTTTGDGLFDNAAALNSTYTFGPTDILNGTVTLTISATGYGREGSCPPAESSMTITINNLVTDIDTTPASCYSTPDGTVTFTASGGSEPYTYVLDGDTNTTGLFTGIAAGVYNYTISDASGCEITGEVNVTSPALMAATVTQLNINCFGASNGEIEITGISGGSGNYEYRINGGSWQSEVNFTGLTPGDYVVEVRDVNAPACIVILDNITITEPDILAATVTHTDNSYAGANDGTITVSDATGGTGNYEYSLDGITWQSSPIFPNLAPDTYNVIIRDASVPGCFVEVTVVEVLEGPALMADIDSTNV